jgi:hypothetical protein
MHKVKPMQCDVCGSTEFGNALFIKGIVICNDCRKELGEGNNMREEEMRKVISDSNQEENKFTPRKPDYSSEGVAVWVNKDKNGKEYLAIHLLGGSIKLVAFQNFAD